MNEERKPSEYDLVLGGNNPPPVDGVVLGGIEGIESKFRTNNSDCETIIILKEAPKYGEAGEDLLYEILERETEETQWIAALLLSEIANKPYKKLFYKPKQKSKSNQIVAVIKKDDNKIKKKKDDLEIILNLVPTEKEKKLVEYFKHIILNERSQWDIWRDKYSEYMLYLREINLCGSNLLIRIDLSNTNLVKANLESANLRLCNLTKSSLCYANLSNSEISHSILEQVDFRKANLEKAYLMSRENIQCHFGKANLSEAKLSGCFTGSNFSDADFSHASLIYSDLREVIIDKAYFHETNFRRANVSGLDFKGIDVTCANFARSIRNNTSFKGANFRGAIFRSNYYEPGWE